MNPEQNNNLPYGQPATGAEYPGPAGGKPTAFISDVHASPTPPPSIQPAPAVSLTPAPANPKKPKRDHSGLRSVLSTILLLAVAPLIAFGITAYALQSYQVDGESMETTLQNNDRLIVDKFPRTIARITGHTYVPHRGDIIIFNQANLPDTSFGETKQLIKRVIGLPGEHVVVNDGKITIFNKENPNGFNPDTSNGYKITNIPTAGDVDLTLKSGQIFVCGDNRPNSEDSRYFGPINANDVVGKLVLRLLPINKTKTF
jgi:signal peptidase I